MYVPVSGIYTFRRSIVNPAVVTNLQIKANAARPIVIIAYGAEQTTATTTNTTWGVQAGHIPTTFGTVTAAVAGDIGQNVKAYQAATVSLGTSATGYTATGEPTYTDTWFTQSNALGNLRELYLPEQRKVIPAGEGFGLKTLVAPPAGTYEYWIEFAEIG